MKDTYGSQLRERMKESMAEEWRATNRRRRDRYDLWVGWASFVTGCIGLALVSLLIGHHWWGWFQ